MLTIAICDDDLMSREIGLEILYEFLKTRNLVAEINSYSNPTDLLNSPKSYDIYILDIVMPGEMNGIELGKQIKEKYPKAYILFNSSDKNYALDAYEVNAFYYFIKPLEYEKIEKILSKLVSLISSERLIINTPYGEHRISINDITYIDIAGRNPCYHFKDKFTIIGIALRSSFEKTLEHMKDKPGFVFLKPNMFINLNEIQFLEKDHLTLKNEEVIYFPRCKYEIIKNAWPYA